MRVLDLNTLYIDGGEGGVNTYLREKARCLAGARSTWGRGVRHVVVAPGARTEKRAIGRSTLYALKSPRFPGNPHHRVIMDFRSVARILRDEAPDVIEVDASYLLGRVAARALRPRAVPIVGFCHVHLPMLYARGGTSWLRRGFTRHTEALAWSYARFCAHPCDRLVVTTRDMRGRLEGRGFPRIELVPLGVNLDLFQPRLAGARPEVPGISPDRPVVLYVGRLSREKDLDVLFAAHDLLHAELSSQLVVAGDGPLRRRIERIARSKPGVVHLGGCPYGEGLARLYRAADVLAVPGRSETFSLIVLEAFASGLPVVAVRHGGPSELCRPGLGELARPGDVPDFASKIRAALSSRVTAAARRGHVEGTYSWERTFERLLEVYEEAIEVRARPGKVEYAAPA